ncbi:Nucleoside-diphosphate-sugar epimerase [Pseudomonas arsenicoxydans]|uniref:Nucleoside-diphosphate-sugar epimerase n=1 Tax=Pseudomonas arsenicoxydans TaxID=702115 RepID=A0A1H0RZU4_9PSED|nr:NAD-dependent epimerase/dehydratase family protein [Pseudomonas arsenicoxydans]SDP34839.1 Nucleoside-diphosphate-sugar epimerase [Pseudomonas arsenicoxydans]
MKFFVTGGSGFIGRALCRALVARGDEVVVLSRKVELLIPNVEVIHGDVSDWEGELSPRLHDVDVVINCMGEVGAETKMYELHVNGTRKLINSFLRHSKNTKRSIHFVQLSSVGAYGMASRSHGRKITVNEQSVPYPVGQYEVSKTIADEIVVTACTADPALSFTILRPTNVVGQGMANRSFHQLANMVRRRVFFYIGDSATVVNYVHVEDVVRALVLCATDERAKNKTYIVSSDGMLRDVIVAMAKYYDVRSPCLIVPLWLARLLVGFFSVIPKFPLTTRRIDALVSKVNYSSELIKAELGFSANFYIPDFVPSILEEQN